MTKRNMRKLPSAVKVVFTKQKRGTKQDPYAGVELSAEFFFRHIFGDKKYCHSASRFNDPEFCKEQIKKLIAHFKKNIDNLIASEAFIANIYHDLGQLEKTLIRGKMTKEKMSNAIAALRPIATFLGYGSGSKHKTVEPYFIPSVWQEMQGWGDPQNYHANSDVLYINYRTQIAKQLRDNGLTLAEISAVLNLSGYRVAQLLKRPDSEQGEETK